MPMASLGGAARNAGGAVLAVLVVFGPASAGGAEVKVDPAERHQTLLGWSVNPSAMWVSDWQRDRVLDLAVNDLGLTRFRTQAPNGNRAGQRRWEWFNDNGDPYEINWDAFATATADRFVEKWLKPFKRRVEARGEKFDLWISPSFFDGGSTGSVPAWLLHSPGEYAEFATSFLLYLKRKHGIEADWYVICNEAGNHNAFTPGVVARMIRTLGPRLKQLGLKTRIQFPESINARTSWRYIQFVGEDRRIWPYVGVLSYHLYGPADPFRGQMRDLAAAKGIVNAQTEQMGAKFSRLYDDLTRGGVSYWSIYGWRGVIEIAQDGLSVRPGRDYWPLRQVTHYVRPGAVRIGASSSDPSVRALAFLRGGKCTVVLLNDAGSSSEQVVAVSNLPAGAYGVCQSVNHRPYAELGPRTVGQDRTLSVRLPRGAVLTIYPRTGGNLPPVVTDISARPGLLVRPGGQVALSAAATDPDGETPAFAWSPQGAPSGAKVVLTAPNQPRTQAAGLTVPGAYHFLLAVRDRSHTVRKQVRVEVQAANRPPRIHDLHNRIPVVVTLPAESTILRAWPVDVEGEKVSARWSVLRCPPGATVKLEPVPKDRTGMARRATGMSVAGEYVFRFHASDGHAEAHKDLAVPVYPLNRPPVIQLAEARLGAGGRAELSARAADPDEDTVTYWWSVKKAPRGAEPVLAEPGRARTTASGLTVPGEYVFTVTAIDRTRPVRRDVKLLRSP